MVNVCSTVRNILFPFPQMSSIKPLIWQLWNLDLPCFHDRISPSTQCEKGSNILLNFCGKVLVQMKWLLEMIV